MITMVARAMLPLPAVQGRRDYGKSKGNKPPLRPGKAILNHFRRMPLKGPDRSKGWTEQ
ncbi:hypothetical protein amb2216 [Paramagnetospirillum magneticum AMB-1]|uniref:Uncharacterized protein n=1 Tax=Paramagnetospirillum magneticum (strain ATCC 700264 / AMB-1) TaxID=342108 RepID=Q2W555_PARM1|nr:hypothetical protein amb2216 [Paramagnetospirillum magneticum AMB-1]